MNLRRVEIGRIPRLQHAHIVLVHHLQLPLQQIHQLRPRMRVRHRFRRLPLRKLRQIRLNRFIGRLKRQHLKQKRRPLRLRIVWKLHPFVFPYYFKQPRPPPRPKKIVQPHVKHHRHPRQRRQRRDQLSVLQLRQHTCRQARVFPQLRQRNLLPHPQLPDLRPQIICRQQPRNSVQPRFIVRHEIQFSTTKTVCKDLCFTEFNFSKRNK